MRVLRSRRLAVAFRTRSMARYRHLDVSDSYFARAPAIDWTDALIVVTRFRLKRWTSVPLLFAAYAAARSVPVLLAALPVMAGIPVTRLTDLYLGRGRVLHALNGFALVVFASFLVAGS